MGLEERLSELRALHERGLLSKEAWDSACLAAIGPDERLPVGGAAAAAAAAAQQQDTPSGATARRRALMESDPAACSRIELAAAYRMAAQCGLNEADQNHFTLMHPTKPDTMLLIPQGMMWSEVRAGDIAEVACDDIDNGDTVQSVGVTKTASGGGEGDGFAGAFDVEISAFVIHAPLHRARSDAAAVLHCHMPYTTALASQHEPELLMVNLNCIRL